MHEPFSINLRMEIQISNRSGLSEFNKRTSNRPVVVIITSETAFRQDVGELILGIEEFDLYFWVQDSFSKPVQRNAVRVFESFAFDSFQEIIICSSSGFVLERLFNVHHATSCRVFDYFKDNVMLQDPNPRGQERECRGCAGCICYVEVQNKWK